MTCPILFKTISLIKKINGYTGKISRKSSAPKRTPNSNSHHSGSPLSKTPSSTPWLSRWSKMTYPSSCLARKLPKPLLSNKSATFKHPTQLLLSTATPTPALPKLTNSSGKKYHMVTKKSTSFSLMIFTCRSRTTPKLQLMNFSFSSSSAPHSPTLQFTAKLMSVSRNPTLSQRQMTYCLMTVLRVNLLCVWWANSSRSTLREWTKNKPKQFSDRTLTFLSSTMSSTTRFSNCKMLSSTLPSRL